MLDHINLSKAIDELPDGYKKMFVLHDVQGYEHNEIAEILGCSIGNSKSQLFKARLQLRKLLQEALRSQAREERKSMRRVSLPEQRKDRKAPMTRPSRATTYLGQENAMVVGATR
jgi:hypothetical protein